MKNERDLRAVHYTGQYYSTPLLLPRLLYKLHTRYRSRVDKSAFRRFTMHDIFQITRVHTVYGRTMVEW